MLRQKIFKTPEQVTNWVNNTRLKKEDIISITNVSNNVQTVGGIFNEIVVFYWEEDFSKETEKKMSYKPMICPVCKRMMHYEPYFEKIMCRHCGHSVKTK